MEVKDLVRNKLTQYLAKDISKEDLYKWSIDILHKMLKGDIFDIRYLEIWGMITELTEINDIDDFYCDELIYRFSKILSGEKSASFAFAIQIPKKSVVNNLSQIKEILQKYSVEKQLLKSEILELKFATQKTIDTVNTLNEILELQIIDLLKLGYEFCVDESRVDFNLKKTVFISEDMSMSLEEDFLAKIITLLECYDGKKCFYVYTSFKDGVGNISIQA